MLTRFLANILLTSLLSQERKEMTGRTLVASLWRNVEICAPPQIDVPFNLQAVPGSLARPHQHAHRAPNAIASGRAKPWVGCASCGQETSSASNRTSNGSGGGPCSCRFVTAAEEEAS